MDFLNVRDFGAKGDGIADDSINIQKALDEASKDNVVYIPSGEYRIAKTLKVHSNTEVKAESDAKLFLCGETPKKRGDFLLDNADHEKGNENIKIVGGIWSGNYNGGCNNKDPDLFNPNAWSGSTMNFYKVTGLHLENMELADSVVYNIRMCRITNFEIKKIRFSAKELAYNQDGLHFGGYIKNGKVSDIKAISKGQTNDDLLALNADDSLVRLENLDLECGPIEDVSFEDIAAEDCHTAIRLLSVDSPISNITIKNLTAGVRCYAVNMDAARYCRTPLFKREERPNGVGKIENVVIDGLKVHFTKKVTEPLLCCESNAAKFVINNFERNMQLDVSPEAPTMKITNVKNMEVDIDGVVEKISSADDVFIQKEPFNKINLSN